MTTRNETETLTDDYKNKPKQKPTFVVNTLRALLLLMMIAGIFYALYTNIQLNQHMQTLTAETTTLKQQYLKAQTELNATLEELHTKQAQDNKAISDLSHNLSSALKEHWFQNNDWLLLKARYYLEMAEVNANWNDNNQTTEALLQQADALLSNIHDLHLFVVRQAIAQDIAQQKATPTIDIAGLLAKLDATQHQLDGLPIKNPLTLTKNNLKDQPNNASSSTWREHLQNSLRLLEKLVVIRHRNDTIEPLLAPEYQPILIANLRLNLQEAQWAVIQQNQAAYQLLLTQALEQINRDFDLNAVSTQTLITQIQELQKTSLNTKKAMLGESLLLLNQFIDASKNINKAPTTGENS